MTKTKVIIIDDDEKNIELLSYYILTYCNEIELVGTASDYYNGIILIENSAPDIIFLDILLNDKKGFEILDIINCHSFEVIFISSYEKYAIESFEYEPVDFLLKPLSIEQLKKAVNRAIKRLKEKRTISNETKNIDFVVIPIEQKLKVIKLRNIVYCESSGNYTTFHLNTDQQYLGYRHLGHYEKILPQNTFIRIHRKYLINIDYINYINKSEGFYCSMGNNKIILSVSKSKREDILKHLQAKDQ